MEIQRYLQLMHTLEALKRNTRHSWMSDGRRESVAEHTWRLALMAYFLRDEFPGADIDRVILMCLCHDLGEAFTGDIPSFLKTEADEDAERQAVESFTRRLGEPYAGELAALFAEMAALETTEAKLYKALDKMEAILQHNEADISTWLPLEYELIFTYGIEEAAFSPYLRALREALCRETADKIERERAT